MIEALNTRLPDAYNVDMIFLGMTFCINNEVNTWYVFILVEWRRKASNNSWIWEVSQASRSIYQDLTQIISDYVLTSFLLYFIVHTVQRFLVWTLASFIHSILSFLI